MEMPVCTDKSANTSQLSAATSQGRAGLSEQSLEQEPPCPTKKANPAFPIEPAVLRNSVQTSRSKHFRSEARNPVITIHQKKAGVAILMPDRLQDKESLQRWKTDPLYEEEMWQASVCTAKTAAERGRWKQN